MRWTDKIEGVWSEHAHNSFTFVCHSLHSSQQLIVEPIASNNYFLHLGHGVKDFFNNTVIEMTDTSDDDSTSEEHPVVSKAWLEAVLGKHFGKPIVVESYTIKPGCGQAEAVLSDIAALHVEFSREGAHDDLHLIVKLLPPDPFSRYFVAEAQFDLREINFYTQIAPELKEFEAKYRTEGSSIELPIPVCYFAKHVPVDGPDLPATPTTPTTLDESVILLQDLKHVGFKGVDFIQGLSVEQAGAAVEAIAKLHALSLAMKIKEKVNLNEKYDFLFQTERASDSYQQLVERGLPALSRFLETRGDMASIQARLAALRPVTKDLIAALLTPDEPLAPITHTDFWSNNLLFKENECVILDWQMVTCSRPTNDLALLIISSMATDLRRSSTQTLLDRYWEHLVNNCRSLGVAVEEDLGYSRARLSADYRRSQLLALLLCIGSVDVAFGNPVTEQRILDVLQDLNKDGVLCADIVPTAQVTC